MPKIRQKKPAIAVTDVLAAEAAGMMMSAIAAEVMTAARKPEKNTKDVVAESIKEGGEKSGEKINLVNWVYLQGFLSKE